MAKTLTAANVVLTLSVPGLIPTPVQIQGFAADDVLGIDAIKAGEFTMGVDGKMSGGFVYEMTPMEITLQGDSDSNLFFDVWYDAMQAASDVMFASGTLVVPSISQIYTLNKGGMETYQRTSAVKKTLGPRTHKLMWERIVGAPV